MLLKNAKMANRRNLAEDAEDTETVKMGSQIYPNATAQLDADEKVIDDEEYFWEKYAQKSISLFPHSPFCDAALLCFAGNPMSDILNCYLWQIVDALLFLMLVLVIENTDVIFKHFRNCLYGEPAAEKKRG